MSDAIVDNFLEEIDVNKLKDDVIEASKISEIKYDERIISDVIDAYSKYYSTGSVTFKTTTKPRDRRELTVRYIEISTPHNPYAIALENNFIKKDDHPIQSLYSEIHSKYPILGYGIDLEVSFGLSKIWTIFQIPQPIEESYSMPSVPNSVKSHSNYFSRFDLLDFSLFALDFQHKTINLYFMINNPGKYSADTIADMIGELNLKVPDEEILKYCENALTIYPTFSWDTDRVERICFGMVAENPNDIPTHLDPFLKLYTEEAPFYKNKRSFIYSITPTINDFYIKIENDYSGTMIEEMTRGSKAGDFLEELKRRCNKEVIKGIETEKYVDWEPEVYSLFEKIVSKVPDVFRPMVKPMLHETSEKKCQDRNGEMVCEADLIFALFDITPDAFKEDSIKNLKSFGVNVQKYIYQKNMTGD